MDEQVACRGNEYEPDAERRRFLRAAGQALTYAGVAMTVAGTARGKETVRGKEAAPTSPVRGYDWNDHRWGYGIDTTKCIGCLRCVQACKRENDLPLDAHHFRTWVERYVTIEGEEHARIDSQSDPGNIAAAAAPDDYRFDNRYADLEGKVEKAFFVPKICNHCARPNCVQVCPVGATYRTPDGVVLVDQNYCIGCGYCVQACPYGARYIDHRKGTADKCTWCYHRITKGMWPACVDACPTGARVFGDLNEIGSDIREFIRTHRVEVLHPKTGNEPQVFYVGLDQEVV